MWNEIVVQFDGEDLEDFNELNGETVGLNIKLNVFSDVMAYAGWKDRVQVGNNKRRKQTCFDM